MIYRKTINRITVEQTNPICTDRTTVSQTHRNGSDDVVGEIVLDDMSEVKDLHYALGCLIDEAKSADAKE